MTFLAKLCELEARATEGSGLDWQFKLALLDRNTKEIIALVEAVENYRNVRGRFHTEMACVKILNALAALDKDKAG